MMTMRRVNAWLKENFISEDYFEVCISENKVSVICHNDDTEEVLTVYEGEEAEEEGMTLYKKLLKKYGKEVVVLDNLLD